MVTNLIWYPISMEMSKSIYNTGSAGAHTSKWRGTQ